MKCPLLLMAGIAHEGEPRCPIQECLEETCAWWSKSFESCDINILAQELYELKEALSDIKDKMPPAGLPR